ncbi:MAG: DNA polymerase Y family protein [Pseudomonadota bacterium]
MATPQIMRRKAAARPADNRTGDLFAVTPAVPLAVPPIAPLPRTASVHRQLWLAVQLTALPLVAAAGDTRPCGVVAGEGGTRALVACNEAALRAGLSAGLALNAARARVPDLQIHERDLLLEQRHLARLARWALGFTPLVSIEVPDALLLEVQGSLRLLGGLDVLLQRVAVELQAQGHAALLGVAPAPRAALWLARVGGQPPVESQANLAGALAQLPLMATRWPARTLEDCTRLGVATLGELRRLPREGLARRFSPQLLDELDEAYGRRATPRRRYVAPERFEQRLELPAELGSTTALLPYCGRLLEALAQYLRERDRATATLTLMLLHRDARPACVRLGRALPTASAVEWQELLRERLGRTTLAAPVRALLLRSGPAVPASGTSGMLDGCGSGAAHAEAEAFALLDRLRARLGEQAISGVCLVAEHRPESAYRSLRPVPQPARASSAVPLLPATPRPLWLLALPEPLAERDGRPRHRGELRLESGPERIESGWWEGPEVQRDYYVARTPRGARLWIYRERAGAAARHWFLHGVFG